MTDFEQYQYNLDIISIIIITKKFVKPKKRWEPDSSQQYGRRKQMYSCHGNISKLIRQAIDIL